MSTVSRSEWFTSIRTASLSHTLTLTSPAKLLMSSFVPLATFSVWSVGARTVIANTISASIATPSIGLAGQRRRAAQHIQLPAARLDQVAAQVTVGRVGGQRFTRLTDRLVDDFEVVLDDRDRRRVEPPPPVLQRLLEIDHRRLVLRIRKAH